jgi:hypothetical protein
MKMTLFYTLFSVAGLLRPNLGQSHFFLKRKQPDESIDVKRSSAINEAGNLNFIAQR